MVSMGGIRDAARENACLLVSLTMLSLFVASHILFSEKNIFSVASMSNSKKPIKIVVFDLDETLGCFVELGMFCDALEHYQEKRLTSEQFHQLTDLFPEFLRPNILKILRYLKDKKRMKQCGKIMIYTNNQGPKSWAEKISAYFDYKVGTTLFDHIIAAFKVHGRVVEICRTSHDKSVEDLIKCTRIPGNTEICFLDDQYHPLMEHDNVYYINVKPYTASIPFSDMARRYYDKFGAKGSGADFVAGIVSRMDQYNFIVTPKSAAEKKVDEVVSKKIIVHLEEFFQSNKKKGTRRKRRLKNGGTRKRS
jgi:hypothetical protein